MNILIVYAHPEPTSFTAALKDAAVRALEAAGHAVEVSDLYAERFNPVAGRHDFTTVDDPLRFHYQGEQARASREAGFAPDIVREQQRAARADLMVFLFPLWWGGLPAILKGWFERVFAYGFGYADGKRFEHGFFRGRRGILGVTTGGTAQRFSDRGGYGEIGQVLHSTQRCMLEYMGLEALDPFVAYAAPRVDAAARAGYLRAWQQRLLEAVDDQAWQERVRGSAAALHEQRQRASAEEQGWAQAR
jgi:NAD(P)H dehydrogenase (quinone)